MTEKKKIIILMLLSKLTKIYEIQAEGKPQPNDSAINNSPIVLEVNNSTSNDK